MHVDELARLPIFAGLSPEQLTRLAGHFNVVGYQAGTQIFAAGDRADQLYVLRSGEVVIRYRPYDGGSLDVALIQPGGAFGWSAALRRAYYTSSALSRTEVEVLTISANALHQVMSDDLELAGVLLERTALIAGSRLDSLGRQVIKLMQPKTHKPPAKRGARSSSE
jgi:CRP/FNR family transcriptional regulator, cyclic AMP receptor protein